MHLIRLATFLFCIFFGGYATSQNTKQTKYRICMDVAHKQRFWNDPARMAGMNPDFIDRVNYMTSEFVKTATSVNAELAYLKDEIKPADLAQCDVVFIHTPSAQYSPGEVEAITKFLNKGGSLFLVMDVDYWSTLEQTNVNDLIRSFGVQFAGKNPDTLSGGSTRAGPVTRKTLKIPFHGARIVRGGTPFCVNARSQEFPFGVYTELKGGGKLIVMGEGMVSLYMTSWEDVQDYECAEFMHDVFQWLLKE